MRGLTLAGHATGAGAAIAVAVATFGFGLGIPMVGASTTAAAVATDASWMTTSSEAAPPQPGPFIFDTGYDLVDLETQPDALGAWSGVQRPHNPGSAGREQVGRVRLVPAEDTPGTGGFRPAGTALRTSLRSFEHSPGAADGDVTTTSGYAANRSEVLGRTASPMSLPAAAWPDPVGSERWYSFDVLVPRGFATTADTTWLTFVQWKGSNAGSPPLALEIKRDDFRLGGSRTNAGQIPNDGNLGPIVRGQWTRLVVGMFLSTSASDGWVEVYRDNQVVLPRTAVATMDVYGPDQTVDPIYLKQGIYRSTDWKVTQTLYFGSTRVAETRTAVLP